MASPIKGRSFLTLLDFEADEINYLLELSHKLKKKKKEKDFSVKLLENKNIALIFQKTSTRTRCAFEAAAFDEGAHVTFLDPLSSQMGKKESVADTAKVLGRFYDGIEFRGFLQSDVRALAEHSGVPVFNGLTDDDHPTQILADLMTIQEHCSKKLSEIKVVFAGDIRNNMALAWIFGCAKLGMHFVGFGPDEFREQIDGGLLSRVAEISAESGAVIEFSSDDSCLTGADVIYTDIWASMGEEDLIEQRVRQLEKYRVTAQLLEKTQNENVLFMHCLPAYHDFETLTAKKYIDEGIDIREVTDEVFSGAHSVVFDEAENRMHTIKAVLAACISDIL